MAKRFSCETRQAISHMLHEGIPAKEIAEKVGCSLPMVYKISTEVGHEFASNAKTYRNEIINDLCGEESIKAIAERYGVCTETVSKLRDELGIERKLYNRYGNYNERLKRAKAIMADKAPQFEYVGGFTDTDSYVIVRCKNCGTENRISMITVRKGPCTCPVCRQREIKARQQARQEQIQQQRKAEREARQEKKEHSRLLRKIEASEQMCLRFCECGTLIDNPRRKLCKDCARKRANKNSEMARRIKLKRAWVDTDITVEALYRRDNGVCWICGGQCDLNDKKYVGETIVCGNMYPSIDHVIPLGKLGPHSWQNVRLAHRICNSIKSDNIVA